MLLGIATFGILAGCQPEKKAVVVINGKPILEEEFNTRVQGITSGSFQQGMTMDAGGLTMLNLIRAELTEQLAAKTNSIPAKEFISSGVEYALRNDPALMAQIQTGENSRENISRQFQYQSEMIGIGSNGAKVTAAELQAAYDAPDFAPYQKVKAKYAIKALRVPDAEKGMQILDELKKTGDFKKAAASLNANEAQAESVAKPVTLIADSTPPELKVALDKLQPNEFAPAPVKIPAASAQGAPGDTFVVVQLIRKDPERVQTLNEVRFTLENDVLVKKNPDYQKHYRNLLADFTNKAEIKINLEKYKGLMEVIRTQAKTELQTHLSSAQTNAPANGGASPRAAQPTAPAAATPAVK